MRTFQDSTGDTWTIDLAGGAMAKLEAAGIDLVDLATDSSKPLETNPEILGRLVTFLVRDQLDAQGLDVSKFDVARIDSKTLDAAFEALSQELRPHLFQRRLGRVLAYTNRVIADLGLVAGPKLPSASRIPLPSVN